ncbi:NlpC/P60 family protein [Citreimonas sp.]|uniref:NlpC/P60 family protein n=1 Tax=Citreimonas sp. TaxID=3036715 RepID=UPI004059307C
MHWSAEYVGIPYVERGYSRAGACCWGLFVLVQREVFGRDLPRHDEPVAMVADFREVTEATFFAGVPVMRVPREDAGEGDLLHMRGFRGGKATRLHCGVLTGPHSVLHTEITTGAIVGDLRREPWRWLGAYRFV